ncbi:hypothetical protein D8B34_20770 [Verminephrobacter eiseniae]|nr:hypothetical protein ET532_021295 [Verminephrobacter sp. Larva24]MCW5233283.1 hypothetical protein [Verminephrobacter eiseniae]MCW5261444.1 hypothetical protein [Verminephrobacter eiseniae]MCW5295164.1 hypothetical protein [Verminephrobacter eiseniae]MCW8186829.1 hypothetical protein [Verminephrobacter eiseniae]
MDKMADLLVSSYFSILGTMCGFALLRALMKIDYRCFSAIFLIVVFVFSFTMAMVTAGTWNGFNVLLTVVLSCICTLTFYLAHISRVKLTDEYLEDPWGRRVLGVILLCFALLFKTDIVELARALPKAMINLRGIGLLIFGMACIGTVGAGMIVYKKDMPSSDAGRGPIVPLPISRSIIMVIIYFMMTAFLFIVINFILHK